MNWTGGRLQQSKRAGNAASAKQKAYFAKARARVQNGTQSNSPLKFTIFQDLERGAGLRGGPVPTPRQRQSGQRRLEEFENTAPLARQLDSLRPRKKRPLSFDEGDERGRDSCKASRGRKTPPSLPRLSPLRPSDGDLNEQLVQNDDLELKRRHLLQRPDWLGTASARPLKIKFPSQRDKQLVGRRRQIVNGEDVNQGIVNCRPTAADVPATFKALRLDMLRPQRAICQEEISIRAGSEIHGSQRTQTLPIEQSSQQPKDDLLSVPRTIRQGQHPQNIPLHDGISVRVGNSMRGTRKTELPATGGMRLSQWSVDSEEMLLDRFDCSQHSDIVMLLDQEFVVNGPRHHETVNVHRRDDNQRYESPLPTTPDHVPAAKTPERARQSFVDQLMSRLPSNSALKGHPLRSTVSHSSPSLPAEESSTIVPQGRLVFKQRPPHVPLWDEARDQVPAVPRYEPSQRSIAAQAEEILDPVPQNTQEVTWRRFINVAGSTPSGSQNQKKHAEEEIQDYISISSGSLTESEEDGDFELDQVVERQKLDLASVQHPSTKRQTNDSPMIAKPEESVEPIELANAVNAPQEENENEMWFKFVFRRELEEAAKNSPRDYCSHTISYDTQELPVGHQDRDFTNILPRAQSSLCVQPSECHDIEDTGPPAISMPASDLEDYSTTAEMFGSSMAVQPSLPPTRLTERHSETAPSMGSASLSSDSVSLLPAPKTLTPPKIKFKKPAPFFGPKPQRSVLWHGDPRGLRAQRNKEKLAAKDRKKAGRRERHTGDMWDIPKSDEPDVEEIEG